MRSIKDKYVINIEVIPSNKWSRMWVEDKDGKKKYFSGNMIIAKQLMKNIKYNIQCLVDSNVGDMDEESIIADFNEDYPIEDFEPQKFTDLVEEVKITYHEDSRYES